MISFVVATLLLLGSPGPATLALAATGAVFGFRHGTPFLFGLLSGLVVAIIVGAAGLATLFQAFPSSQLTVQICGGLYIAYVAWKIATAPVLSNANEQLGTAPSFRDGFILNLLNPKAYAAFLALFSQFRLPLENEWNSYIATAAAIYGLAILIDVVWLALGGALRPLFQTPKLARIMRVIFAVLMLVAVIMAFGSA